MVCISDGEGGSKMRSEFGDILKIEQTRISDILEKSMRRKEESRIVPKILPQ